MRDELVIEPISRIDRERCEWVQEERDRRGRGTTN